MESGIAAVAIAGDAVAVDHVDDLAGDLEDDGLAVGAVVVLSVVLGLVLAGAVADGGLDKEDSWFGGSVASSSNGRVATIFGMIVGMIEER